MNSATNKTWFITYVWMRNVSILLVFGLIASFVIDPNGKISNSIWLTSIPFSVLVVLLVYERLNLPGYILISRYEDKYIEYFIPDVRYFFVFSKSKIKKISLTTNDEIRAKFRKNIVGDVLLQISIVRSNEFLLNLPEIGLGKKTDDHFKTIIAKINA